MERLISAFEKNSREQVRILIGEYKGTPVINVRVFWTRDGKEWFPSAKGISLSLDKLPQLVSGLNNALSVVGDPDESLLMEDEKLALCARLNISPDELDDDLLTS